MHASDAVIGKVGYSTLAEAYHAGIPFGFIARDSFRESDSLVSYINEEMAGLHIKEEDFFNGKWIRSLPELLSLPRLRRSGPNGSDQAAHYIYTQHISS